MSRASDRTLIDDRCDPRWCIAAHDSGAWYAMEARCENCGLLAVVKITKGHEAYRAHPDCPRCDCSKWVWGDFVSQETAAADARVGGAGRDAP